MAVLHYVTNRPRAGTGYGTAADGTDATFATLRFGGIDITASADPGTPGTIAGGPDEAGNVPANAAPPPSALVDFLAAHLADAARQGATPLLYVHGFNYGFADAAVRTADVQAFLRAAGAPALAPLLFTWPSLGALSMDAYLTDRASVVRSGPALAGLLLALAVAWQRAGQPAMMLLVHSMGTWMLDNGLLTLARRAQLLPDAMFAQGVVMAGDDDTDALAPGKGLNGLAKLAPWVTVGINHNDMVVAIDDKFVLDRPRLAQYGPADLTVLSPNVYVIDYTQAAATHAPDVPPGETTWNYWGHNYYHTVPRIGRDLAQVLANVPPDQVTSRYMDPKHPHTPTGAQWLVATANWVGA